MSDRETLLQHLYWLKRAESAPPAKALKKHLEEEASFLNGIDSGIEELGFGGSLVV